MTSRFAHDIRETYKRVQQIRNATVLTDLLQRGSWIYGAGGYGCTIHRLLSAGGFSVHGFIDRRAGAAGAAALPARAITPEALGSPEGATLVVGLHSFGADPVPVLRWARDAGFGTILSPVDLPDVLGPEAGSYWLTGRSHVATHADRLAEVAELLADDRSREILATLARFRVGAGVEAHPPVCIEDQYFPRDLPTLAPGASVMDGGACVGELWAGARTAGVDIDAWFAFEPDPANFARLVEVARGASARHIALFPCGLGGELSQARFASGETSAHLVGEGEGDTVVQVVALDEVLFGIDPTFVKLDIEGAERAALRGMRRIVERARPRLAVAVYHRPDDLWELPLLIHSMMPEAKLHLRQHGHNGFDTVLYALP